MTDEDEIKDIGIAMFERAVESARKRYEDETHNDAAMRVSERLTEAAQHIEYAIQHLIVSQGTSVIFDPEIQSLQNIVTHLHGVLGD